MNDIEVRSMQETLSHARGLDIDGRKAIVTDPPYNQSRSYGSYGDNLDKQEYIKRIIKPLITRSYLTLDEGEYLIIVINDEWQPYYSIHAERLGFQRRNDIIWHYTFGQNQKSKFTPSKTHILSFSKGRETPFFDWEKVGVESWRHKNGDKRASGKYRTMRDVWTDIPRLVHNNKEWMYYTNQLPLSLTERVLLPIFGDDGGTVIDPFCGTGSVLKSAHRMGLDIIGGDINARVVDITRKRLVSDDPVLHEWIRDNRIYQCRDCEDERRYGDINGLRSNGHDYRFMRHIPVDKINNQ